MKPKWLLNQCETPVAKIPVNKLLKCKVSLLTRNLNCTRNNSLFVTNIQINQRLLVCSVL